MDAFTNKTSQQPAAGGAPAGQKDDYVDKGEFPACLLVRARPGRDQTKPQTPPRTNQLTLLPLPAFAFGAKKSGHNVDKNTAEKITDGARGLYEKATGKKVDPKISN